MSVKMRRRIEALERQDARRREAAGRAAFLALAPVVLIVYFVGHRRPDEQLIASYERALGYETEGGLHQDFAAAFRTGNAEPISRRYCAALSKVFDLRRRELPKARDQFETTIIEMAKDLPEDLQIWLETESAKACDEERPLAAFER